MTTVIFAQVTENQKFMSQGTFNSLSIELPDGSGKDAPKEWAKYIKQYGKAKKNRKTKEYFVDDAEVQGMSNNSVDIYAKFEGNTLSVWFDLGGAYLSSREHIDGYAMGEQILMDFGLHLKTLMVSDEVAAEEKVLKKMEMELERLTKEKATHEKNIEDWKAKIAQAELDIEQNIQDQEAKTTEIEQQKTIVDLIKGRLMELKK
ncbi:MAG: coiled-coil domain-containing protein 22 [Saprospiraceae bacterium]|nr:coiled-coil domain-containing protein 22 [Saprospiraceae bacterium]